MSKSILHKIAVNTISGKFKLSNDAIVRLSRKGHVMATESLNKNRDAFDDAKLIRHDPILIEVIQELGNKASADGAHIFLDQIVSPMYKIKSFDGIEKVKEIKEEDPKAIHIVEGDHLSQYVFEGLQERLDAEKDAHDKMIAGVMERTKELLKVHEYAPQDCYFTFTIFVNSRNEKHKAMVITSKASFDKDPDAEVLINAKSFAKVPNLPEYIQENYRTGFYWEMPGKTQKLVREEMEAAGFVFSKELQKKLKN